MLTCVLGWPKSPPPKVDCVVFVLVPNSGCAGDPKGLLALVAPKGLAFCGVDPNAPKAGAVLVVAPKPP